ncbi:MAG: nucleoside 2-deoxyribosyltransferase [Verrucomicrobiota bacterium]|jgi:nucleoside 2-deoxyribosyltransferase
MKNGREIGSAMTKHLLTRTKCYLAGSIENSNSAHHWRDLVKTELKETGIIFFDPLKKPFLDSVNEDKEHMAQMVKLRAEACFKDLSKLMRKIRVEDLSLVDRADFLIASISAKTASWGTAEEVFWANRMKKPIFLVVAEGRRACPFWIFGTLPEDQIYDSLEEAVAAIKKLDSGEKAMDLSRWKIFREEYR